MKEIIDPVHNDYIHVDDTYLSIIDSDFFQRLRRIKQLGFSDITYPSATHTRFEHSLGVFYLTNLICNNLENITTEQERDLKLAALLHDIGHGPFSHVSEFSLEGFDHLERSHEKIRKHEDDIPGDVDRIIDYTKGERLNIISGHIDADRMDYLKRDSEKCGIDHGNIDINTLYRSMKVYDDQVVLTERALSSIESLLIARSQMIRSVYTHHASLGAELLVARAIKDYANKHSTEKIVQMDDYEATQELRNLEGIGGELFNRVLNRNLFGKAYKLYLNNSKISKSKLKDIEKEIAEESGLEEYEVIVKKSGNRYYNLEGEIKIIRGNGEIKDAEEVSSLIGKISSGIKSGTILVYCPKNKRKEVKKNSKKIFKDINS